MSYFEKVSDSKTYFVICGRVEDGLGPELHVVPVDGDAVAAAQRLETHPGLAAPHPRVQPRHLAPLQDDSAPGVPAHRKLVLQIQTYIQSLLSNA